MRKLLAAFCLLVGLSALAQNPIMRNSWSTNIAGTPVRGQDNLSVTNLGSGTNWNFFGTSGATIARFYDVSNIAALVSGAASNVFWFTNPVAAASISNAYSIQVPNSTVTSNINWTGGRVAFVPINADIQTYVNEALPNDTLILGSGTYTITATITITNPINVLGQGSIGFVTSLATQPHGTRILSTTASVIGFQVNTNNVRISNLSINLTGSGSKAIATGTNLVGLSFSEIDAIVTAAGACWGFDINGSDATLRNMTFYVYSVSDLARGVSLRNDTDCINNNTVELFNVSGSARGAATYAYGAVADAVNAAKTLTLNIYNSVITSTSGTPLDAAVASIGAGGTAAVNAFLCTFSGADWDSYQNVAGNLMALGGSVLVNNKISGTPTYRATMVSGSVLATNVTVGRGTPAANAMLQVTSTNGDPVNAFAVRATNGNLAFSVQSTDAVARASTRLIVGSSVDAGASYPFQVTGNSYVTATMYCDADVRAGAAGKYYWTGSGATALYGNANGVGISTNNPQSKLHVADLAANSTPGIRISSDGFSWVTRVNGAVGSYNQYQVYDPLNNKTPFSIAQNCSDNTLVLTNGNAGVGTAIPLSKLSVVGNTGARFADTDVAYGLGYYAYIRGAADDTSLLIGLSTNILISSIGYFNPNRLVFSTYDTASGMAKERMRIHNGSIGIGTTNPTAYLNITNNSANIDLFRVDAPNTVNAFMVKSNGYVGVGVDNPTSKFQINTRYGSPDYAFAISQTNGNISMVNLSSNGWTALGTNWPDAVLQVNDTNSWLGPFPFVGGGFSLRSIANFAANCDTNAGVILYNGSAGQWADMRMAIADSTGHYISISEAGNNSVQVFFDGTRKTNDYIFCAGGDPRNLVIGTVQETDVIIGAFAKRRAWFKSNGRLGLGTELPTATFNVTNVAGNVNPLRVDALNAISSLVVRSNGMVFVRAVTNDVAPPDYVQQPIALFGSMMKTTTNTVVIGSADTFYVITNWTTLRTNGFSCDPGYGKGFLTNAVAGYYRVSGAVAAIPATASETFELEVFLDETGRPEIGSFGTYDNPARVRTLPLTGGVLYIPAGTGISLRICNRTAAHNVDIWRASLTVGTP